MKPQPPFSLIDRLENASALDPVATRLRSAVDTVVRPQWLRDVLHGVPLGHPLHPVAVQVPIGAWLSATVVDLVPGQQRAAKVLVATGVVSAIPAALAGYTDWSQLHEQQVRVGFVHSGANLLGTSLYVASFVQRSKGRHGRGKALSLAGLGAILVGGVLGGHLSYRQASGANHVEDVPHRVPPGWHAVARLDELEEARLERRLLAEVPLVLYRRGSQVDVLAGVCSHLSGPLDEGSVTSDDGELCVVCPWHESTFSLSTGEVVHGPATSPQPVFETRVLDGTLEVRLANAS